MTTPEPDDKKRESRSDDKDKPSKFQIAVRALMDEPEDVWV